LGQLLENLTTNLSGRREGGSWRCECPVHRGQWHLRVTPRDGKILVYCFQDATQSEVLAALSEMGLWT